jgi:hypothetical protein
VVVGRGGQGDYVCEVRARKGSGQDFWIETAHQNGQLFLGELFTKLSPKEHGQQLTRSTEFAGYPDGCR